jgi:hypothetical protein
VSRRIRSFLLCLAVSAVLPLVLPGVAPAQAVASSAPAASTAAGTSGLPTHFAGGCESGHHLQPSSVTDLQQQT